MWRMRVVFVCILPALAPLDAEAQDIGLGEFGQLTDGMVDSIVNTVEIDSDAAVANPIAMDPAADLATEIDSAAEPRSWKDIFCQENPSDIICLSLEAGSSDHSFIDTFTPPAAVEDIANICSLDPDSHPECFPGGPEEGEPSLEALPPIEELSKDGASIDFDQPPFSFRIDRTSIGMMEARKDTSVHCNSRANRPAEVWREIISRANENKACSDRVSLLERVYINSANRELNRTFQGFISGDPSIDWRSGLGLSLVRDAEDYVQACTTPLEKLSKTVAYSMLFGPAGAERLPEALGVLQVPGRRHYCSATLVRTPSGGVGLLTAAHCLNAGEANANPLAIDEFRVFNFSLYDKDVFVTFATYAGKSYDVKISSDLYGFSFARNSDVVILRFEGDANIMQSLERYALGISKSVALWQPVYIIGSNPFWYALHTVGGVDEQDIVKKSLVLEHGSHCRILNVDNGYVWHGCQTEGSMSGSALIVIEQGRPMVAGIHTGAVTSVATQGRPEQCGDGSVGGKNTGVLYPSVSVGSVAD